MTSKELHGLIEIYAERHEIPPDLGAALIMQESQGVFWASRFEEKWFAAKLLLLPRSKLAGYVPTSGTPSLYDEKIWRAHSWGLCQVMGDRARILGFKGDFLPELISNPEIGLDLGFKYLRQCFGDKPPALMVAGPESPFGRVMRTLDDDFTRVISATLRYNGGGDKTYPHKLIKILMTKSYYKMIGWEAKL
jgi:hypothetical protein